MNDLESVKTLDCVETESTVNLVQFHPDGLILATGSTNGQVKLWDIKSRSLATQFTGHSSTSSITSLAFSENGYHFASTCNQDSIVKFWDLRKLSEFYSLDVGKSGGVGGDFVGRVRFDHSGKYVAVASSNLLRYDAFYNSLTRTVCLQSKSGTWWPSLISILQTLVIFSLEEMRLLLFLLPMRGNCVCLHRDLY